MSGIIDALKVLLCIAATVVYGIVHDQFTARICLEYFTVFHPPIFPTQSPNPLALGRGVLATGWIGAFLGRLLALAARIGLKPKLTARDIFPFVEASCWSWVRVLLSPEWLAIYSPAAWIAPPPFVAGAPHLVASTFMADWWAHSASYASGLFGGMAIGILVYRKRLRLGHAAERELITR